MKQSPTIVLSACLALLATCYQSPPSETAVAETPVKEWLPDDTRDIPGLSAPRGLISKTPMATPGYILFHPSAGTSTYLMDLDGMIVHEWKGTLNSMNSRLLEDGRIMRMDRDDDFPVFAAGGQAGRIREYSWDGTLLWDYEFANEKQLTHHDFEIMPNGNILAIAWEVKSKEEALHAGRNPELIPQAGLWPDMIIEIEPQRPMGGKIVWEWHLWDHLVQEFDSTKANFGRIREHPRKVDINAHAHIPNMTPDQIQEMKKQGNMTSNATVENRGSDMTHINSVSYNADLDQIALSTPHYHEIWIIDHSTTTEEAKGSTGGRRGHGGDLLYRWGNPANYGRGEPKDQTLFGQHDVHWIPQGMPGAGNLLLFNNDIVEPGSKYPHAFAAIGATESIQVSIADLGNYSAVYELIPPMDSKGVYNLPQGGTFGPDKPHWSYQAPDKYSFYAPFVSAAHRLENGNTFITSGPRGRLFEVTSEGSIVWEYWNPYFQDLRLPDGTPPQPVGPFKFAQFRATHISVNHPGLKGRTLKPLEPQPAVYVPPQPQD